MTTSRLSINHTTPPPSYHHPKQLNDEVRFPLVLDLNPYMPNNPNNAADGESGMMEEEAPAPETGDGGVGASEGDVGKEREELLRRVPGLVDGEGKGAPGAEEAGLVRLLY